MESSLKLKWNQYLKDKKENRVPVSRADAILLMHHLPYDEVEQENMYIVYMDEKIFSWTCVVRIDGFLELSEESLVVSYDHIYNNESINIMCC